MTSKIEKLEAQIKKEKIKQKVKEILFDLKYTKPGCNLTYEINKDSFYDEVFKLLKTKAKVRIEEYELEHSGFDYCYITKAYKLIVEHKK